MKMREKKSENKEIVVKISRNELHETFKFLKKMPRGFDKEEYDRQKNGDEKS